MDYITDIDSILREACGMNYGKAIELCQKDKEVHDTKRLCPLMVFIKENFI